MATDSEGLVRVSVFSSEQEATEAGGALLEAGVVSVVEQDPSGAVGLFVFPTDVPRGCELLGVPEPEPEKVAIPLDQPLPVQKMSWKVPRDKLGLFIVLYLVILIGLTVAVFFVVFWLFGGADDPDLPSRGFS